MSICTDTLGIKRAESLPNGVVSQPTGTFNLGPFQ